MRTVAGMSWVARRRVTLLRMAAMGGIAAVLILAPLAGALSGVPQRINGLMGHGTKDGVVAVTAADQDDDDGEADDEDDEDAGEDGSDEDDEDDDGDHEDDEDDEDAHGTGDGE